MEVRVRNDGASEAMAVYFGDSHSYRGYNSWIYANYYCMYIIFVIVIAIIHYFPLPYIYIHQLVLYELLSVWVYSLSSLNVCPTSLTFIHDCIPDLVPHAWRIVPRFRRAFTQSCDVQKRLENFLATGNVTHGTPEVMTNTWKLPYW
jgi:hypothetical protein